MTRGFLIFVQDNGDVDYLKLATACAMSIKKFMPKEQVCLVTDIFVPDESLTTKLPNNCKVFF